MESSWGAATPLSFMPVQLTLSSLQQGVRVLSTQEPGFARIVETYGLPPLWQRDPGFATLIRIILEQQVSLASAKATFERLQATVDPLTPSGLMALTDTDLKCVGFSRQKIVYARALAEAILSRTLDLDALASLEEEAVRQQLLQVKGIGLWTANIYLLLVLMRADVWPKGDLALQVAIQQVQDLPKRPTADEARAMSAAWQPWRSVAARLLWHFYLSERQQTYS